MITVIIPAYNCETFIGQALASSLRQTTEEDLEILVIDDCSKDMTLRAARQLLLECGGREEGGAFWIGGQAGKRKVRCLRNPKNLGVAETRNLGIKSAAGEYVAFLDADDWWEPEKLEKQTRLAEKTDAPLIYSGRELMRPDGSPAGKAIGVPLKATYSSLLRTNCIPCSSVVMKTEIAREFYMCHDELHEDYILWLKVLKKYGAAYGVNEPLLKSRLSEGGKSRNKLKSAKMHYGVYKYMGIPAWKAVFLFLRYAINGVRKYW